LQLDTTFRVVFNIDYALAGVSGHEDELKKGEANIAKTGKELAVELAGKIMEAAFNKERDVTGRYNFLQLSDEKVAKIVKASYDAIHALPKDEEDAKWV